MEENVDNDNGRYLQKILTDNKYPISITRTIEIKFSSCWLISQYCPLGKLNSELVIADNDAAKSGESLA